MVAFSNTNIPAIEFIYISKERMKKTRLELKERFSLDKTIQGQEEALKLGLVPEVKFNDAEALKLEFFSATINQ